MGLITQAACLFGLLTVALAIAVIKVAFTRTQRFSQLVETAEFLFAPPQVPEAPEPGWLRQEHQRAVFELRYLPTWLVPLLEHHINQQHHIHSRRVLALFPLAFVRGQLLMAFIGSLMVLVGLLLLNTSLILFEAVGILSGVLGLQVIAGAIREGALSDQKAGVEAEAVEETRPAQSGLVERQAGTEAAPSVEIVSIGLTRRLEEEGAFCARGGILPRIPVIRPSFFLVKNSGCSISK
jgi:hypothetical protein